MRTNPVELNRTSTTYNYLCAARYGDRILKRTPSGDLPIELPTTFELVVNLKTAKGLGIAIPQSPSRNRCCCRRTG
jgi:ABC-type uncharacterized transport system substrate-binding protein